MRIFLAGIFVMCIGYWLGWWVGRFDPGFVIYPISLLAGLIVGTILAFAEFGRRA